MLLLLPICLLEWQQPGRFPHLLTLLHSTFSTRWMWTGWWVPHMLLGLITTMCFFFLFSGMGDGNWPPHLPGQAQHLWGWVLQGPQSVALLLLWHLWFLSGGQVRASQKAMPSESRLTGRRRSCLGWLQTPRAPKHSSFHCLVTAKQSIFGMGALGNWARRSRRKVLLRMHFWLFTTTCWPGMCTPGIVYTCQYVGSTSVWGAA